ncbi:MAG: pyrroloquinoline quinone biosynthesis peptide chaperone PqqD [Gemmatimonadales bacterium]
MSAEAVPRIAPKARLEWDEVRGRHVLLYPEGLVALNATGVEILKLCDGTQAFTRIVATLRQRYGAAGIDRDVAAFLDGLAAKGLVMWEI